MILHTSLKNHTEENQKKYNPLIIFTLALLSILFTREFLFDWLLEHEVKSYVTCKLISLSANFLILLLSWILIKKNGLVQIAGIKGVKLKRWYLLIFPLVYMVLVGIVFTDGVTTSVTALDVFVFTIYAISIGFAEELSIRGFLQSYLIKIGNGNKPSIFMSILISSIFFGLVHFIKFDKGIYGEVSQLLYATFIGFMFGTLLVVTKKIYPLILIHIVFDFIMDLDTIGQPFMQKTNEYVDLENAIVSALIILPCFIYGLFIYKKFRKTLN